MGPVEVGVEGASHNLALVVDAAGKGAKISRQKAEVCNCAVLPKSGKSGCAVRAATLPNNLALVVMPKAILERAIPKSGSGNAVPFSHSTA
jgi:hypothetical protein